MAMMSLKFSLMQRSNNLAKNNPVIQQGENQKNFKPQSATIILDDFANETCSPEKKNQKTACKKKIDKIFFGRSPLTYRSPAIWIQRPYP